jgi:hypothetical protein
MYNSILNSLERKEMSCFVFCDFSKALDKVWHHGLLHKLKAYGINGNLFDWFHSYLNEREKRVVIKDPSSSFTTILGGDPQGSVLRPLLFIISVFEYWPYVD